MMEIRRPKEFVEKRATVKLYRNWLLSINMMDSQTLGDFMHAVIEYLETGQTPEYITESKDCGVRMMFENFKVADDISFKKFKIQCEVNRKNRNAVKDKVEDEDKE